MFNLLDIIAKQDGNWYFSNKAEALIYALIGFLVVFVGIALIIAVVWLIGLLMKKTDNLSFLSKKSVKKQEVEIAPVVEDDGEISDELKAVIMATIMAFYEEEKPQSQFVVKRIKRI